MISLETHYLQGERFPRCISANIIRSPETEQMCTARPKAPPSTRLKTYKLEKEKRYNSQVHQIVSSSVPFSRIG